MLDLTPYLQKEPELIKLYNPDYMSTFVYDKKNYVIPFYISKTLLYYNKIMFKEAGLSGPPTSFDELISFSQAMAKGEKTGFITLNFDWLYWPLMKMNGVELLSPDLKKPAFNTPAAVAALDRLAKATESGGINKVAWTGRWVEPNGAFAGGNVGMLHAHSASYFFVKGQGRWINPDTLGAVQAPGDWSTPTNHGFAVSKSSKNPDLAFALIKHMTSTKWATRFSEIRRVLTANIEADKAMVAAHQLHDGVEIDIFVMVSGGRLGGRREQRFRQARRHRQSGRQRDAADRAVLLVVLVAGPDQVAAHHGFQRQGVQFFYHHGAPRKLRALVRIDDHVLQSQAGQVIGHDVASLREPEQRDSRQDLALERDGIGQYDVEGRQTVGGDDEQMIRIDVVDVPHFSLMDLLEAADARLEQGRCLRELFHVCTCFRLLPLKGAKVGDCGGTDGIGQREWLGRANFSAH